MSIIDTDIDDAAGSPSNGIQKVIRLMQAMMASDSPQPLADLADRLDMPKATVHRLLAQLEEVGVAQRDLAGKGYTIGPTWLRLAVDALTARAQQLPVQAIMRKLVDQIGESCNLGILQDLQILYLERVECDWPLRMQLQAGSRVPVHCTASGKLYLARMSTRQRRTLLGKLPLERYTAHTLTDPEAIEEECKAIRATGVSVNREEYHLGLIGAAVPVLRDDGTMAATLAVHAPSFRVSIDAALMHVPLLREAAAEIAKEINK
ncbi:MAG TPA: IclR family transcriptional regulator [Methylovirgula sp.]|nr:IclR family transcriptional regulator [Methylovirgula sp.]